VPVAGVSADEGIRPGGTMEKLASLKPAFKEDGKITAANSSQISDGSAALLMMTSEKAAALGLTPIARIHTAVLAGVAPMPMLHAPMPATLKAFQRSGSPSTTSARSRSTRRSPPCRWPAEGHRGRRQDDDPNGGAIALGHPLGGSGTRLMTTLVHHMRDHGIRYGLQTCARAAARPTPPSSSCCSRNAGAPRVARSATACRPGPTARR
jgi:acetyl-CoA acyltransferase